MYVLWLLVASPYWNLSHLVIPHTHLECSTQSFHINQDKQKTSMMYDWFASTNKFDQFYKFKKLETLTFVLSTKVNIT